MLIQNEEEIRISMESIESIFGIPYSEYKLEELIDGDKIEVPFDDEVEIIKYPIVEFLRYSESIRSFKVVDSSTVRTDLCIQTAISGIDNRSFSFIKEIQSYTFKNDDVEVRIIDNPFLIGMYNSMKGNCDDNYCVTPCSQYHAIELHYLGNTRKYKVQEENEVIARVLYYLTTKYNHGFSKAKFFTWEELASIEDEDYRHENEVNDNIENKILIENLIPYSLLLEMYRKAIAVEDNEIRFLCFYKMIEYTFTISLRGIFYFNLLKRNSSRMQWLS